MSLNIEQLKKIAQEATPGPWPSWSANVPFYVVVTKPAPSQSKHDREQPTYWRYEDGLFVNVFNPKQVLELLNRIEELENESNL